VSNLRIRRLWRRTSRRAFTDPGGSNHSSSQTGPGSGTRIEVIGSAGEMLKIEQDVGRTFHNVWGRLVVSAVDSRPLALTPYADPPPVGGTR
jgi:hypothetical protein